MNRISPIVMPFWIFEQFSRNAIPLQNFLKLEEALKICSKEDLASALAMNRAESINTLFGIPSSGFTINQLGSDLQSNWNFSNSVDEMYVLEAVYITSAMERLFPTNSVIQHSCRNKYKTPFTLKVVDGLRDSVLDRVCFVIVYPGYFNSEQHREVQDELCKQYLELSYAYVDYNVLAQSPIFSRYLDKLANEVRLAA